MRTTGIGVQQPTRGPFPRPRVSMRDLIRLVLTFAIANAFLAWVIAESRNPIIANSIRYEVWNIFLALFLGLAFLRDWIDSMIRWRGYDRADARRSGTRLADSMAMVICGLMFWSGLFLLLTLWFGEPRDWGSHDRITPIVILVMGTASMIRSKITRGSPAPCLTERESNPTMVGESHLDSGETS